VRKTAPEDVKGPALITFDMETNALCYLVKCSQACWLLKEGWSDPRKPQVAPSSYTITVEDDLEFVPPLKVSISGDASSFPASSD
jgi:hypothetical protein